MRLWQGFLVLFFSFFFFLVFSFLFPSASVDLNWMLQVFCFLGSPSCWTCSSSSSSSFLLLLVSIVVFALCGFALLVLVLSGSRSRSCPRSHLRWESHGWCVLVFIIIIDHLHHVLLHESCCSTVTSCSSSSCCTHPLCSRLGPCCPVPCAADLCLLAQRTWRSSSRCAGVLSWSRAAPKCRAGWPQVALPWRNESWSPVGPISTAQYNSTP